MSFHCCLGYVVHLVGASDPDNGHPDMIAAIAGVLTAGSAVASLLGSSVSNDVDQWAEAITGATARFADYSRGRCSVSAFSLALCTNDQALMTRR